MADPVKYFEIYESGDPYSKAWDCTEMPGDFEADTGIYRGDISGIHNKTGLIFYLRRMYPGCKIRDRNKHIQRKLKLENAR